MAASSLRVGVVLASMTQPAWVCRVIDHVRAVHRLALLVVVPEEPSPRPPFVARLFRRLDDLFFGRRPDGVTPCDVTSRFEGVPVMTGNSLDAVDVILAFAPFDSPGVEIWSVERDGLWAFAAHQPTLGAALKSRGRVLARTNAMPDAISFRRAMSRLGLKIAAMLEHELDRRAREGSVQVIEAEARSERPVTNGLMIRAAASAARAWISQQTRDRFMRLHWSIAFSFTAGDLDFRRFHPIVPPPDRLWADPFVVADGDRAWIFIEELVYRENRGVISVLEARRDGTWSAPRRILERPYHLSYPCVFRWNGDFYMVPESYENRTVELYRCVDFPFRWQPDEILMTGTNAVDPTIFEANDRWWMYLATHSGDAAEFDRLWLFYARTPRGPWMPHRCNPLECDVVGGRPGGRPFLREGRLLRATQIGTPWYGHSIRVREIVRLTPDEWKEREVSTIAPDWSPGLRGTHTLNVDRHVTVIDALRHRWRR